MRKFMISLVLVFTSLCLFAADTDPRTSIHSQEVGGYVDDICKIQVGAFINPEPGRGINLDYTNENSVYRYNIMPTASRMTTPGLLIAYLDAFMTFESTTYHSGTLTITHDTMHTNSSGEQTELDYELALVYVIYDGTGETEQQTAICLSSSSQNPSFPLSTSASEKRIQIFLVPSAANVCFIENAGIHFRLADAFETLAEGTYTSTVSFILESI